MLSRAPLLPGKSFLLLGPRGTGKSTWLQKVLPNALRIDLLKSSLFLKLGSRPEELEQMTSACKPGSWVIIDEVQRVPELLNEVHSIYESRRLHFALSGSSARKLRRGGANLLAGRALSRFMFPFVRKELGEKWNSAEAIDWGTLPLAASDPRHRSATLSAYVETYLRQELLQEGLLRKIEPFTRFLQVAGILNGQILNVLNVSRDAHVGRTTVDKYFEVLEDTLIGLRLPAYQPGIKIKETAHPKFYFFDSGVARACAGLLEEEIDASWRGFALETYVLHELRAYNHYCDRNRPLSYYGLSGGAEIDFVVETRKKTISQPAEAVTIEIKHARKWDRRWCEPSLDFGQDRKVKVKARFGVYLGIEEQTVHGMKILPLAAFLEKLWRAEVF